MPPELGKSPPFLDKKEEGKKLMTEWRAIAKPLDH